MPAASLRCNDVVFLQGIKEDKDAAALAVQNEAERLANDLGLELDRSVKLEWFKSNNVALRCLRITPKEVCSKRLSHFLTCRCTRPTFHAELAHACQWKFCCRNCYNNSLS
jgi:hypothetical protein